jgi:hypothetical protein
LKEYKKNPTVHVKNELWDEFDALFGQKTGYDDLDNRLSLTFNKKSELLTVLDYPVVPLHNNLSEKNRLLHSVAKNKLNISIYAKKITIS